MTAIIQLDNYRKEETKPLKSGIIKKPGSNKLYIDLRPNGLRVQKSSTLDDTPENRERLQGWVERQKERIENGTFRFSEAFPNASEKEKAKHANLEGREYRPDTGTVFFEDYVKQWTEKITDLFRSVEKKLQGHNHLSNLTIFSGKNV